MERDFRIETRLDTIRSVEVPGGDAWRSLGNGLAAEVGRFADVAPPVVESGADRCLADLGRGHRILVGTVHTNPLVASLYRRKHTLVDDYYPGRGGWVIQTVHNPGNVGHNAIVIGLSDPAMAGEVLDTFRGLVSLSKGVLGYINRVKTRLVVPRLTAVEQGRLRRKVRATFKANTGRDALERGIESGLVYALTGHREYLELFMFVMRHYHGLVIRADGEWEFEHMLFPYAWIWRLAWLWDMIEESEHLSDDDRLEVIAVLRGLAGYTSRLTYFRDPALTAPAIRQNHPTFAALSMYFAGRYFRVYYGEDTYERELKAVSLIMDGQRDSFKPDDDANSYCYLAPSHLMQYDLAHDDFRWIQEGHLRRICDYAALTTDNLDAPVGFGDVTRYTPPGWCYRQLRLLLSAAGAFYRSGRYRHLLTPIPQDTFDLTPRHAELGNFLVDSVGHYALDLEEEKADIPFGLQLAPLTAGAHRLLREKAGAIVSADGANESPIVAVPLDRAFDKLALRGGDGAEDEYLLIDGVSGFVHDHEDVGSVLRLTWMNRMWLVEGDYIRSLPKYHNSLVVVCDGETQPVPVMASLEYCYEYEGCIFMQVRVGDYNGVHWRRNIIWRKGGWFLFVDTVDFLREADYVLTLYWRLLGSVRSSQRWTTSRQSGVRFRMAHGDHSRKTLTRENVREIRVRTGAFHRDYPHAADPTKVLCQEWRADRDCDGSGHVFFNLMVCGGAREVGAPTLVADGEGAARFSGTGEGAWQVLGREFEQADRHVSAGMTLVGEGRLRFVHCRAVRIAGRRIVFSEPVFLELNLLEASAFILAPVGARASGNLLDAPPYLEPGASRVALPPDAIEILKGPWTVEAGRVRDGVERAVPNAKVVVSGERIGDLKVRVHSTEGGAPGLMTGSASSGCLLVTEGMHKVVLVDPSGIRSAFMKTGRPITAVQAAGSGGGTCVAVGGAGFIAVLGLSGEVRWSRNLPLSHYRVQQVNNIVVTPLAVGEEPSVLICTDGWLVHCFNLEGEQRWVTQIHHHAAKSLCVGDADGDGRKEILVGTEYHTSDLLESNGAVRWTVEGGPEFIALGFCDFDSAGLAQSIFGTEGGSVYGVHTQSGKVLWESNVGDRAQVARMLSKGRGEALVVGSAGGEIVRLDVRGRKLWRLNLGSGIVSLQSLTHRVGLVAFTSGGDVVGLAPDGVVELRHALGRSIIGVVTGPRFDRTDSFYVAVDDGRILHLTL